MTLLSIVGEDISRIIPVLFRYKNQIKHHVLLCDDESSNYDRAKTLQSGMKKFSNKYKLDWKIEIIIVDEDSAFNVKETVQNEIQYEGELWINITDGYPAITILLSDLIRKEGGKVLSYDHFDNDLHIIDSTGNMKTKQLTSKMDLNSYMMLLNYKIIYKKPDNYLKSRKKHIETLYKDERNFHTVREVLVYPERNKDFDSSKYKTIMHTLKNLGILDENSKFITSKQLELQGELFEEYMYWLCRELNPDDIAMGVKIDFDDSQNEPDYNRRVHNEFDVLMINNNRIYTVECKFAKNLKGLEFVYKYDAIIDYFGKTSKAIIANISPNEKINYIGMNTSSNFRPSTLRRARMAGVAVYHEEKVDAIKFQNLVQSFFKVGE